METGQPDQLRAASGTSLSRRGFITASAAALLAACRRRYAVTLGVQSYSFRDRSLDDAIGAMQLLGLRSCELWQDHVEPKGISREEKRKWRETVALDHFHRVREKFSRATIGLSAYNISFRDDFSDAEIERGFEMAAALGAPLITSSSNVRTTARVASIAERRKMLVGMHNHSRIDPNEFATAQSLVDALKAGPYIAVNLDIGHFTAANQDAVAFLQEHHDRIVTLHLKDRKRDQGETVPFGRGDAPIKPVLELLQAQGWPIPANIEYEYKGHNALDEVARCIEYCGNVLNL
ncbi:MAG TPA: TIM barrel protein [Vicinamibacterales bacterium]